MARRCCSGMLCEGHATIKYKDHNGNIKWLCSLCYATTKNGQKARLEYPMREKNNNHPLIKRESLDEYLGTRQDTMKRTLTKKEKTNTPSNRVLKYVNKKILKAYKNGEHSVVIHFTSIFAPRITEVGMGLLVQQLKDSGYKDAKYVDRFSFYGEGFLESSTHTKYVWVDLD